MNERRGEREGNSPPRRARMGCGVRPAPPVFEAEGEAGYVKMDMRIEIDHVHELRVYMCVLKLQRSVCRYFFRPFRRYPFICIIQCTHPLITCVYSAERSTWCICFFAGKYSGMFSNPISAL